MLHSNEQQGGAASVASGTLMLAGPTAAMSSRLMAKKYLPTASVAMQLPAGLADMSVVPRLLRPDNKHDEAARLAGYVASIRSVARVFATYLQPQG